MIKTNNPILNKALEGERISEDEAIELFEKADILDLSYASNEIRKKYHPNNKPATYVVQRNINYSNVCTASCTFCAFYTYPGQEIPSNPAYVLDYATMHRKIQELVNIGGTEILLQGGHNPSLGLNYYTDLFKKIKKDFPNVTLHALSPAEIVHIAEKEYTPKELYGDGTNRQKIKMPNNEQIKSILLSLKEAGMDSLPGAGAEILTENVRKIIANHKISTETWLKVMEIAHSIGFRSSATMMYGHVETYRDRVQHFGEIRKLQDLSQGFTAFVTWNFQRGDTPLGKIMDSQESRGELAEYNKNSSGEDYIRTLSIARIFLDNISNFQSSWVTQGTQVGQLALLSGCNDLGGNMMEENVVSAANTTYRASVEEMRYYIKAAGREAQQRDTQYNPVHDPILS